MHIEMSEEVQIVISGDRVRFIHQDDLAEAMQIGKTTTRRATHVEPGRGGWNADLRPVNGPVLGPFARRDAALEAEAQWLRENSTPIPRE
jgi:hypothetical protein